MTDSARWCSYCWGYGDHHTDRHGPMPVQPWPRVGCVFIIQHHENPGPTFRETNRADGWIVVHSGSDDYVARSRQAEIHPNVRAAQAAAKKKWPEIKGWKLTQEKGMHPRYEAQV